MQALFSAIVFYIPLFAFGSISKRFFADKCGKVFVGLSFIYFAFIIGLRDLTRVGPDSMVYVEYFNIWGGLEWGEVLQTTIAEPGFALLNKFIYSIYPNPQFMALVISVLILAGPYALIQNFSSDKLLSVFIYSVFFLFSAANTLRRDLALSFICLTYCCLGKRKYFGSIICSLFAFAMHNTGIVGGLFIIFYGIMSNVTVPKRNIAFCFIPIGFLCFLFTPELIGIVSGIFDKYFTYQSSRMGFSAVNFLFLIAILTILIMYIKRDTSFSNEQKIRKRYSGILYDTKGSILIKRQKVKSVAFNDVMFSALIVASICAFIAVRFNLFDSVTDYFLIIVLAAIPEISKNSGKTRFKKYVILISILYLIFLLLLRPEWTIFPYYFMGIN